jgi:uncharacterized protein (TIGR03032 family)
MDGRDRRGGTAGAARAVNFTPSRLFTAWLADRRASIALTTGADGRLVLVGMTPEGKLSVFMRAYEGAYGLSAASNGLLMGSLYQVWRMENAVAPGRMASGYDRLYVPRIAYTTGEVQARDVAFAADGTVLFANTLFSCVAAASAEHSFVPIWRPAFVSRLLPEDRCHLTGFALEEGLLRFVTVAAGTDAPQGWRARARDGGMVIDAATDTPVAERLALPASPRLHAGHLWLVESGSGLFGYIDLDTGRFEDVAFCPGWANGVDFIDKYVIVGVSAAREGFQAQSLPLGANLAQYRAQARTALLVFDMESGELVHWLRLEGFDEIADVAVLTGTIRPAALGLAGDDIRRVLSIGPDRSERGTG